MPDILHDFLIAVPPATVFRAISTSAGLDRWWTKTSADGANVGDRLDIGFGPEYAWRARVLVSDPPRAYEIEMEHADVDWKGTRIAFQLDPAQNGTQVRFRHAGWQAANDHYRILVLLLGHVPPRAKAKSGVRRGGAL